MLLKHMLDPTEIGTEMTMNALSNVSSHEGLFEKSLHEYEESSLEADAMDADGASFVAWGLLGKRWTLRIIIQLLARSQSFIELSKHIQGISESVLSERLKELERAEVIQRRVHSGRPVRITYHLTVKGLALEPVIKAIGTWSRHC
jgi:DNA-binding HxlR family transcriptional regulator